MELNKKNISHMTNNDLNSLKRKVWKIKSSYNPLYLRERHEVVMRTIEHCQARTNGSSANTRPRMIAAYHASSSPKA